MDPGRFTSRQRNGQRSYLDSVYDPTRHHGGSVPHPVHYHAASVHDPTQNLGATEHRDAEESHERRTGL